jgi:hypothetical protein
MMFMNKCLDQLNNLLCKVGFSSLALSGQFSGKPSLRCKYGQRLD